jgi:2-dehydropantoate 2-reductase
VLLRVLQNSGIRTQHPTQNVAASCGCNVLRINANAANDRCAAAHSALFPSCDLQNPQAPPHFSVSASAYLATEITIKKLQMKIAFLGLGGVGGYFGAKLSRQFGNNGASSGEAEIIFLAREKTAAAVRANGIKVIAPEEEFTAHPHRVLTPADEMTPVDFLICSVKSYDLEAGLAQFSKCIGPGTVIIPLLNGVDAEERIRAQFPENEVWSGCTYLVSRITAPGVITKTGAIQQLHFGSKHADDDRQHALLALIQEAHDEVWLCHERSISKVLWEKFIFISPLASLTSFLDVSIGKILEHEGNSALLNGLLNEVYAVACAEQIPVAENIIASAQEKMKNLPHAATSSMHSDFQKGNATEYNSLTAHVVQLARRHGIATPHYDRILAGLQERTRLTGN